MGWGEAIWCEENPWEPGGVTLHVGGQAGVSAGRRVGWGGLEGRQESSGR